MCCEIQPSVPSKGASTASAHYDLFVGPSVKLSSSAHQACDAEKPCLTLPVFLVLNLQPVTWLPTFLLRDDYKSPVRMALVKGWVE